MMKKVLPRASSVDHALDYKDRGDGCGGGLPKFLGCNKEENVLVFPDRVITVKRAQRYWCA